MIANKYKKEQAMTKEEYNKNPHVCEHCGEPIVCNETDKLSRIIKQKFCSKECYYEHYGRIKSPGIYCIKNISTGKVYIGQTTEISKRIYDHLSRLRNNCHHNDYLQKAWNKYGEKDFEFTVLRICSVEDLDEAEIFYIEQYNSTDKRYGYNHESGGHSNKSHDEETRDKISKNHCDVSGENNPFYGKKHSGKTMQKITSNPNYINRKHIGEESHFAKLTEENAREIKLYLKNNETSYEEEKELARKYNVGINAIQKIKHNRTWKHIAI